MFRAHWLSALCLLAVAIGFTSTAHGALALYNTGAATSFVPATTPTLLPEGSIDPHYLLSTTEPIYPNNQPDLFVAVSGQFPFGYWLNNGPNSQWIEPVSGTSDNAPPASGPNGDYYISTALDLTGYNPATADIKFLLGSDNEVKVYIQNISGTFYTGIDQTGFSGLNGPYALPTSSLVSGMNTLIFDVINYTQDGGNPTGLRVEYTAASASVVPEVGSLAAWSVLGLVVAGWSWRRKK